MNDNKEFNRLTKLFQILRYSLVILSVVAILLLSYYNFYKRGNQVITQEPTLSLDSGVVENGIHLASGLKADEGLDLVLMNCTNCHSAKLIIQNRATREGWKNMITWMQETQSLWNLGENEDIILDYLSENYAPEYKGRRQPLEVAEWYELR